MKNILFSLLLVALLALTACGPVPGSTPVVNYPGFTLSSPAFQAGGEIPPAYTCNGNGGSPALAWGEPPSGTQSFALIFDDPDAPSGVYNHWVIFNIPATSRGLPESVALDPQLPDGTLQGKNTHDWMGYLGPCPPSGTHHYSFELYALDMRLGLPSGALKADLLSAMGGHILAQAELIGTYHQ
jgi:Raf kinase inhibitor-like YbhB/YbcL family protein